MPEGASYQTVATATVFVRLLPFNHDALRREGAKEKPGVILQVQCKLCA